jgi:hypothetical protein
VASSFAATTSGAVVAEWTFETSVPTSAGPHAAEVGTGSATGFHASASTVYSNPVGNASAESFSSNFWAPGDYYQFQVSLSGLENPIVSWDQTRSSTGPATFDFQYSINGTSFTTFLNDYTVLANATSSGPPATSSWSSGGTRQSVYTFSVDLTSVDVLDDEATVYFRLTDSTSAASATAGTNRVDNFLVDASAIPEPTSLALIGLGGLALLHRRRATVA